MSKAPSKHRPNPLPQIEHVVVLMLENRSFDNLMGWLYDATNPPKQIIGPADLPQQYQGLAEAGFTNPTSFKGGKEIAAVEGTKNMCIPTPDPNEKFKHMNQQLFGSNISGPNWLPPEKAPATMNGFVVDYGEAQRSSPQIAQQIMQTYSTRQVQAISTLAYDYAISDAWHASNPTQTLPNRAFMAAGTSEGRVNNLPLPIYGAKTIFNVLEEHHIDWKVYNSSFLLPSLTRLAMLQLWDPLLDDHFHSIDRFCDDAANGNLPPYSFLEPLFIQEAPFDESKVTSEHPPSDVCGGEYFLAKVWEAVRTSKNWESTLFIVTFDEHGGCSDHVPPPWTATPPDPQCTPGDEGFGFNRFGVRIPTIMASPYIAEGTVFRAFPDPGAEYLNVPYDHTSTLATVLDWQGIPRSELESQRVMCAPTFESVLTLSTPRTKKATLPIVPTCNLEPSCVDNDSSLTDLENGILGAFELYRQNHKKPLAEVKTIFDALQRAGAMPPAISSVLDKVKTRAEAMRYLQSLDAT